MSSPQILELTEPKGESLPLKARPLVRVENLGKFFPVRQGIFGKLAFVRAVDGVSLFVRRGETLGLVGESGCGKSTLGRTILRLIEPTYGRIVYDGKEVVPMKANELRGLRRKMQIIFQDPHSSLNPKMTVRDIVGEALRIHALVRGAAEEEARVATLLDQVGLRRDAMTRYPHEFSGGQRQRIGIARALAVQPEFIVCDEPISALDVSIQAQIINLLQDLQEELKLAFLFISHDLKIVEYTSHRVAVMYLGKIVETATTADLFEKRYHPYTRALLSSIPLPDPGARRLRVVLEGDVPSPLDPPAGCAFHPRCPRAQKGKCDTETPELDELVVGTNHRVACFFPET
ncbi:MAG TPA: oligopeptide/dipeptide ABC transporter ATP-binding protein [Polyangiaceae bacterium]|nr:oligopeptide/dipeptide ABC transporter ATP-binding protein [Polyangiaceae bacterium]